MECRLCVYEHFGTKNWLPPPSHDFLQQKNLVRIGGWILCHESLSFLAQSLTKNPSVLDPDSHRQGDMLRPYNPDGSQTIDFLHLRPIFCNKKPRANRWLDCNQRSLG